MCSWSKLVDKNNFYHGWIVIHHCQDTDCAVLNLVRFSRPGQEHALSRLVRICRQGIHYQYLYVGLVKIRNVKRSLSDARSAYISNWLVRLVRVSILGYYYVTLVSVNGKGHS